VDPQSRRRRERTLGLEADRLAGIGLLCGHRAAVRRAAMTWAARPIPAGARPHRIQLKSGFGSRIRLGGMEPLHAKVRNAPAPCDASSWRGRSFHTPRASFHSLARRRLRPMLQVCSSNWRRAKAQRAVEIASSLLRGALHYGSGRSPLHHALCSALQLQALPVGAISLPAQADRPCA
jgi:hypothetical protein